MSADTPLVRSSTLESAQTSRTKPKPWVRNASTTGREHAVQHENAGDCDQEEKRRSQHEYSDLTVDGERRQNLHAA